MIPEPLSLLPLRCGKRFMGCSFFWAAAPLHFLIKIPVKKMQLQKMQKVIGFSAPIFLLWQKGFPLHPLPQ